MLDIMCSVGRVAARVSLATAFVMSILVPAAILSGLPVYNIPFVNLALLASNARQLVTKPYPLEFPGGMADFASFVASAFITVASAFYIIVMFTLAQIAGPYAVIAAPLLTFLQASMYVYIASIIFPKFVRCSG